MRHAAPLPAAALLLVAALCAARLLPLGAACGACLLAALTAGRLLPPKCRWTIALLPLGLLRGLLVQPAPDVLHDLIGRRVVLRGFVAEPETVTPNGCRFVLEVRQAACGSALRETSTRVVVYYRSFRERSLWPAPVHWGQEACAIGVLEDPAAEGSGYSPAGRPAGASADPTADRSSRSARASGRPAAERSDRPGGAFRRPASGRPGHSAGASGPSSSRRDDGFDYAAWLAERGVYETLRLRSAGDVTVCGEGDLSLPRALAARLRRHAEATFARLLPAASAALLDGVVLADSRTLPRDTADAFRATGTYHVLVTAGLHVNFVVVCCIALLGACGVGGGRASLLSVPVVWLYALVAGASPPIVRASIMGTAALVGHAAGRRPAGLNGLALAALLMTAWDPRLIGEAGFQMSVACVLGILWLMPPLSARLRHLPERLRTPICVTLSTQIALVPLSALYFGTVSLAGLFANLVVVPLCELLLAIGLAMALVPVEPLLRLLAVAAWGLSSLVCCIVGGIASFPLCAVQVPVPNGVEIVSWYACVWAFTKLLRRGGVPEKAPETPDASRHSAAGYRLMDECGGLV